MEKLVLIIVLKNSASKGDPAASSRADDTYETEEHVNMVPSASKFVYAEEVSLNSKNCSPDDDSHPFGEFQAGSV